MRRYLFVLLCFFCIGCKEQIIHNLTEQEANRVLTRLHQGTIEAEKKRQADGTWAIAVPRADTVEAISYLSDARIFRSTNKHGGSNSSIMSTREEQRFQFERALSSEIEATLTALEGVLEARVHLNLPLTDPLFGRPVKGASAGTASVLLVTEGEFTYTEPAIAKLVSGASGIAAEQISVLISVSKITFDRDGFTLGAGKLSADVSGATAEIGTETPYSWWKIGAYFLFFCAALILVGALLLRRKKIPAFHTAFQKEALQS